MTAEFFLTMVHTFGYFGVFLASLIGSSSILLPLPSFLVVFTAGTLLNPVLVGLAAGLGAALGELTSYGLGYGTEKLAEKRTHIKKNKWFIAARKWAKKRGMFIAIFVFSVLPLPFDFIGILSGALRYDVKKFFLATLTGKIIKFIIVAYAGFYGITSIGNISGF